MAKKRDFFWASYADLMTSLFIITLVLFVLSYKLFQDKKNEYEVDAEKFRAIQQIEEAVSHLDSTYFSYQAEYKRHVLKTEIQFKRAQSRIPSDYDEELIKAGQSLQNLIEEISDSEYGDETTYMLIIEGRASKDGDAISNYRLSYERALALFHLWEANEISFQPPQVEVIIAGNGEEGIGRNENNDEKNRRFLIQIIPKIGSLNQLHK